MYQTGLIHRLETGLSYDNKDSQVNYRPGCIHWFAYLCLQQVRKGSNDRLKGCFRGSVTGLDWTWTEADGHGLPRKSNSLQRPKSSGIPQSVANKTKRKSDLDI